MLSPSQQKAFDAAMRGESIFIAGPAGYGKSYLLRKIIKQLEEKHGDVVVTTPQWSSAKEIGGVTVHSALKLHPSIIDNIRFNDNCTVDRQWLDQQRGTLAPFTHATLIVDEISMVSGDLFSLIKELVGDRQLIVSGDFAQLPPVAYVRYKYAFDSPYWVFDKSNTYMLTEPFRQTDAAILAVLERIRRGAPYTELMQLPNILRPYTPGEHNAIYLSPHLASCREINSLEIRRLNKPTRGVPMVESDGNFGRWRPTTMLALCEGAKVVLTRSLRPKNILYNGRVLTIKRYGPIIASSIAKAIKNMGAIRRRYPADRNRPFYRVMDRQGVPKWMDFHSVIVEVDGVEYSIRPSAWVAAYNGVIKKITIKLPLQLGWAITFHRAQGMTLDEGVIDLEGIFEPGMVYLGITRFRDLSKVQIKGELPHENDIDPRVIDFYSRLMN